jgi:hypothetical protein
LCRKQQQNKKKILLRKLINKIKYYILLIRIIRINPLFTANNPAPIPGCHTSEGCCTQCCGPLDLTQTKLLSDMMVTGWFDLLFFHVTTWNTEPNPTQVRKKIKKNEI